MSKPLALGILGAVTLAVSGAWAAGWFDTSSAEGTYGQADVAITVGAASPDFLPITLPQTGMLLGVGLMLIALLWAGKSKRRTSSHD